MIWLTWPDRVVRLHRLSFLFALILKANRLLNRQMGVLYEQGYEHIFRKDRTLAHNNS